MMSWKNLKLSKKMGLCFGLVVFFVGGAGLISLVSLYSTTASYNKLLDHEMVIENHANTIRCLMLE